MKNLITSVAFLMFFSIYAANATTTLYNGIAVSEVTAASIKALEYESSLTSSSEIRKYAPDSDLDILNPESVLPLIKREIAALIAEDLKITDSKLIIEEFFVFIPKSLEETIISDNQVIDSNINLDTQLLYIEKSEQEKIADDNRIIGTTLDDDIKPLKIKMILQK